MLVIVLTDSFQTILSQKTIFKNRNVLLPQYIPETLPHREEEIRCIMKLISPALKNERPSNVFIYGGTGTGKTSCVKHVVKKFTEIESRTTCFYINCRVSKATTTYRIFEKIVREMLGNKTTGHGFSRIYEWLTDWMKKENRNLIVVLDEIDMVQDIDELVYVLTRSNDDLQNLFISFVGISNKISLKERLGPRSKSTLFESEIVFTPYNAKQLKSILEQRVSLAFHEGCVDQSAINLAAAIAAQETGDARYALKLLLKAGELVDEMGASLITDKHVEAARRSADEDIAVDAICSLPDHQQLVLYAVASLSLEGGKYSKLSGDTVESILSGDVYERYKVCARRFGKEPRSARWFRHYLNELEMLGLITMTASGKGQRGRTRFIHIEYPADKVARIIEMGFL
ncbi:MAG: AAA family ATPase [Candidatus Micrarchaeia archaeon]